PIIIPEEQEANVVRYTVESVSQAAKPVQQTAKPVQQAAKPVQQTAKPVQQAAKPVQQAVKPVQQTPKPVQQTAKPVQQTAKPVQQTAKPVQQTAKPVQQTAKPVQQTPKPVQQTAKPVQQTAKPVQQAAKPVQQTAKPVQQTAKPVQQAAKPVQQAAKPVQQKSKPIERKTEKTVNKKANVLHLVNAGAITLVLLAGFSYLMFLPRDTVSHEENRNLTQKPEFTVESYLSGDYTEGLADYYDDTVPNRSFFKNMIASVLMPMKGVKYGDGVTLHGGTYENNKAKNQKNNPKNNAAPVTTAAAENTPAENNDSAVTTAAVQEETTPVTTLPDANEPANDNGEITNNIMIVNNRGLMLYGGAWGSEKVYADYVNEYKERLGNAVNVYSMVLPTAVSFYLPENYKDISESEKADLDSMAEEFKGVKYVDAYTALLAHKDEHIYSQTDHHWQHLGAYYAAQAFANSAGVPFADFSKYDKVKLDGYVGTIYGFTQSADIINNPEEFVYFKPKDHVDVKIYDTSYQNPVDGELFMDTDNMSNSDYYLTFALDEQIKFVHTGMKNGRTLVIFKDSYGNALPSLLTYSFENIYLCDIRYFEINAIDFIKEVKATDVLFAMNTFSAVSNQDYIKENIDK
ncbi:MAG: hypothetical protein IJM19_06285, partial [Ruminococcus sp.]|nr:hypothetical protein [Ruminococcus sp.]